MSLLVRLNTPGQPDGQLEVAIDGQVKIAFHQVCYRLSQRVTIDTVFFAAFFGGSDASWAPQQDTWALFRGFRLPRC